MDIIIKTINKVNTDIHSYNLKELYNDIFSIFEMITGIIRNKNSSALSQFNDISNKSLQALVNKDYQLLSDILIYELLPFLDIIGA